MRIAVIGGGPAGIMAALKAKTPDTHVFLFEKNNMLGKKLMITGKGRCNLTNAGEVEDIINAFGRNGKFLYSALYNYTNQDLMDFFEEKKVPLKVERGNRVFPKSDKSLDIVEALQAELESKKIRVKLNSNIKSIRREKGMYILDLEDDSIEFDKVIIATGGVSYPKTGSTGDGHKFGIRFGHSIKALKPFLIPLESPDKDAKDLMGLSLKNINLKLLTEEGKVLGEEFGEMIFTHFGISGPIVLTISKKAVDYLDKKKGKLIASIDMKPALSKDELDKRILRDFDQVINKDFKNSLDKLLPKKMIPIVMKRSGIDLEKKINQITKEERKNLVDVLKGFTLEITKPRPISEAIVTAGGISLKEVCPSTMESKIMKGLYFAGEVLDLDAITGGYNLQEAFSTGYLAGESASTEI